MALCPLALTFLLFAVYVRNSPLAVYPIQIWGFGVYFVAQRVNPSLVIPIFLFCETGSSPTVVPLIVC